MMGLSLSRHRWRCWPRSSRSSPRPADLRDDPGDADHAAPAVRLRHQHRSRAICRRRCWCRTRARFARADRSRRSHNSGYFDIVAPAANAGRARPADASAARSSSRVTIPGDFTRRVVRGDTPQILVEADATDPVGRPAARPRRWPRCRNRRWQHDLVGPLAAAAPRAAAVRGGRPPPLQSRGHHRLQHRARACSAIILTMTLVMMTALGVTRETRARHHGDPARHAGAADRGDGRQARALRRRRARSRRR